jgi:hypothetical protein
MRVAWAIVVSVIALGAAVFAIYRSQQPSRPPPAPLPGKDTAITPLPLPSPIQATEFAFSTETTRVNGRRHLVLRAGDAAALLKIADPTDYAGDRASGRASIEALSPDQGARFIEDISLWLKAPKAPSLEPAPVYPLFGTYVSEASLDGWERLRLRFSHGATMAEVEVKLSADGARGAIVEVVPEVRGALIDLLAGALRDGFARRTPEQDANFETNAPYWSEFQPLGGENNGSRMQAWPVQNGAWGTILNGTKTTIVWWDKLSAAPTEIARIDGIVTTLTPAPKGRRAVAAVVRPSRNYPAGVRGFAADDLTSLLLLDPAKAQPVVLIPPGQRIDFRPGLAWSPLGSAVAVESTSHTLRGAEQQLRVFDVATGSELGATTPNERTILLEWGAQGVIFASATDDGAGNATIHRFRWTPSGDAPKQLDDVFVTRSPDGKYSFALAQGAIEISGPTGLEPFPTIYTDDRKALEYAASVRTWWLGGHRLLLVSDDLLVFDLSTRKLRYAFPATRSLLVQGTSTDGETVIVRDEEDRLFWSTRQR